MESPSSQFLCHGWIVLIVCTCTDNNSSGIEEQSSESKRNCSHESETALLCRPSNTDRTDIVAEMEGIHTKMEENHFRTWDELEEVPTVESTLHWYEGVKQAWPVVDLGLSSLEWGLSFLRDSLQVKRLAGKSCYTCIVLWFLLSEPFQARQ